MFYEEPLSSDLGFTIPPLGSLIEPPPDPGGSADFQFSETGFLVIGAEHANSGQMMLAFNAQGAALAVAFADGDGNWNNEEAAIAQGLTCLVGIGALTVTDGMAAYWVGAGTAIACFDFLYKVGVLYDEYQGNSLSYSQSVLTYLNPTNQYDGAYVYTYKNGGSWTIEYDSETQTFGPWVWKSGQQ
jgi:hypothetical protein